MNKKILFFVVSLCSPILANAQTLVVASERSDLNALSKHEVRQLYMGNATTADGNKVLLLDMPEGSAVRQFFYDSVAGKNESQLKSYWARMLFTGRGTPPRQVRGPKDMARSLKANPDALGYLEEGDLQPGLKVLLRLP